MSTSLVKLTGQQAEALIHDGLEGDGPCLIATDLTAADLAGTSVLPNARILMAELDGDGVRLTAKGNFQRKLVESMVEKFRWPGYEPAEVWFMNKVLNETDFVPVEFLHIILRQAGLARPEKGFFKLTRKGRALLPEAAAGKLQASLFRATFLRYNLAYLDLYPMPEMFAWQISLILYLIGQFAAEWRSSEVLMRAVTLPYAEGEDFPYSETPWRAFEMRVLRYLEWFGLIEAKPGAANDDWDRMQLYRRTALFDRMLSFRI